MVASSKKRVKWLAAVAALVGASQTLQAQSDARLPTPLAPATQPATAPAVAAATSRPVAAESGSGLITLNFPDNMPLKTLIDYVSMRANVNILYDEKVASKKLTIKAPAKVPESSLMGILESALKMNGLALVDADQKGWKQVVAVENLVTISHAPGKEAEAAVAGAVTQIFAMKYADGAKVDQLLKPFLSGKGANTVLLAERGILIVTDYASNMGRLAKLVELMDQPREKVLVNFVKAQHMDVAALTQQALTLLNSKYKGEGGGGGGTAGGTGGAAGGERVQIIPESRTNQLVLIGTAQEIAQASEILQALDVDVPTQTHIYQFRSMNPERMDQLVRQFIGEGSAKSRYQSAIDKDGGTLIVTAAQEIQDKIAMLQKQLDVPATQAASPVRFYKLTNTTADDVLKTIQAIEGQGQGASAGAGGGGGGLTLSGGPAATQPGSQEAKAPETKTNPENPAAPVTPSSSSYSPIGSSTTLPAGAITAGTQGGPGMQSIQTARARITADANTNSIIIIADPATQAVYEQLIRQLDKRRPQVLLECILVTLDTSDGFSLGVEISGKGMGSASGNHGLAFSSFGLSTVDPSTGTLTLTPSLGFNGAFLSPDVADVVIHAVSTNSRATVVSAPRVLVNDNATGTLASVNEAPFTSINASTTVSTTSFAGYATAGTTISVTPHISEGDHLQLEYQVTLSSFTGAAQTNAPPPRQTNTVQSKVTIPDGGTIVVGGLNRMDQSNSVTGIPILDQIPILNLLTTNRTNNHSVQSLFVFIRPIVLRDDDFADIKYLSSRDVSAAELPPDMPRSEPMTIR